MSMARRQLRFGAFFSVPGCQPVGWQPGTLKKAPKRSWRRAIVIGSPSCELSGIHAVSMPTKCCDANVKTGAARRIMVQSMETPNHSETPEKDLPLRYDIRLLGRILGDTLPAQEGDAVFELVEHISRTAVHLHRNADEAAPQDLQPIMSALPTHQALRIIQA